jgi:hypothetical protein
MSRHEQGQSLIEYLAISLPILLALLALGLPGGPIQTMANTLMGKVDHQFTRTDHGTVDAFLP